MALSTGLALLAATGVSVAGQIIGGNKQAKATKDAANIATEDNAANREFLTGIYNKNAAALSPWQTAGITSNNAIMELLGLAQPGSALSATVQPSAIATPTSFGAPTQSAFAPVSPGGAFTVGDSYGGYTARNAMGARNLQTLFDRINSTTAPTVPIVAPQNAVTTPAPAPTAQSAFDAYRNSTGYNFRFDEGTRALQSAFSRNLESGAAVKSALRFGQGIASDEFGRYMDLLRGQSQLGLSGASALAGVGQNFGNNVVAGNNAAATAQANARLYSGYNAANNWASLGSSFGSILGMLGK